MTALSREPIYLDLDRKREVHFNMNAAILLRDAGVESLPLLERVGERDGKPEYRIDVIALRAYLWAGLAKDARANGERLTIEDVGDLVDRASYADIFKAISKALDRFYGVTEVKPQGEEKAAREESGSRSRGRSKSGSASSAAS